jgi:hypothetical protein
VTKAGGAASYLLQTLAPGAQELTNDYNLTVLYHHIPGVENIKADQLSRRKLPKKWSKTIERCWGR